LARLRGNFIGQPGWFRGQGGFGDSFFFWPSPGIHRVSICFAEYLRYVIGGVGFNASKETFQPSRNTTLYDIDAPILAQLRIWFSNIFNDREGNYCWWINFVSLLVRPAPFAFRSFRAFILMETK
jgi:hypothetical protein